jgi:RNA polymerase sigma-70 factor (ECF subfamily)
MKTNAEDEFVQFWDQTCGKVRAYMFCACCNASDAEDLTQDCFVRAFRNWEVFHGTGSRQAWLFAIARNAQVDWFRKLSREKRALQTHGGSGGEVSLEPAAEDTEALWRAIEGLGPDQREVIHLRFAAGLSYAEIAEMLGVPVGTVRSRLHRGLETLRGLIEE